MSELREKIEDLNRTLPKVYNSPESLDIIMQFIQQERVKAQGETIEQIEQFWLVIPKIDADYSEFPPSMPDVRYVVKQALDINFKKLLYELKQSLAEKGEK